jgi:HPt (histidine-containing phosphotransfer) domain-containing protein
VRWNGEKQQAYAILAELLGGDSSRIKLILGIFHQSISKDLQRMERAAIEGEWPLVRKLVHRMAIGCRQVGEERMADVLVMEALTAIERARYDVAADPKRFEQLFMDARCELIDVLDRAAAYASAIELDSVA